jgi:hypothetical protein
MGPCEGPPRVRDTGPLAQYGDGAGLALIGWVSAKVGKIPGAWHSNWRWGNSGWVMGRRWCRTMMTTATIATAISHGDVVYIQRRDWGCDLAGRGQLVRELEGGIGGLGRGWCRTARTTIDTAISRSVVVYVQRRDRGCNLGGGGWLVRELEGGNSRYGERMVPDSGNDDRHRDFSRRRRLYIKEEPEEQSRSTY